MPENIMIMSMMCHWLDGGKLFSICFFYIYITLKNFQMFRETLILPFGAKAKCNWNEICGSTIASSSSSSNPKHTGHFFSKAETWQKTMRSGILYSVVIFVRIPDYMPLSMCRCVDMAFTNQDWSSNYNYKLLIKVSFNQHV